MVSAFPFDSNDVATLDGQGPSRRSTADSSVWGSNGAGSGGGGGHGTEGGHRQRSSPGKRTRRSELETGHADTAMRALNKLRIGFANKKLEAHDSVAAGLMHTPKLKPQYVAPGLRFCGCTPLTFPYVCFVTVQSVLGAHRRLDHPSRDHHHVEGRRIGVAIVVTADCRRRPCQLSTSSSSSTTCTR